MPVDVAPRPLPLLCADLPGTGGASKVVPEDFEVEELPSYLPQGSGPHLYLWIEKRGLGTRDAMEQLAKVLGADLREAGSAGQKDRHAVTRQWLSFLTNSTPALADLPSDPALRVLKVDRHANRLRTGHLRGNRFRLVLRDVHPDAAARAAPVVERLKTQGLPNFYGPQRFGRRLDNALLGAAILGLAEHPEAGKAKRDHFLRRLALSALQSELFNRCLTDRMQAGLLDTAIDGDVLRKRATGGTFNTTEPDVDAARVKSGELDVTGPMPGPKERPAAKGAALAREDAVLQEAGVPRDAFAKAKSDAEGARRPYRIPLDDLEVRPIEGNALELRFSLPSGSYATRVVAELARVDVVLPGEG